jgi:hypothetical protein
MKVNVRIIQTNINMSLETLTNWMSSLCNTELVHGGPTAVRFKTSKCRPNQCEIFVTNRNELGHAFLMYKVYSTALNEGRIVKFIPNDRAHTQPFKEVLCVCSFHNMANANKNPAKQALSACCTAHVIQIFSSSMSFDTEETYDGVFKSFWTELITK